MDDELIDRLRKRAEIRRKATCRGAEDRLANDLDEAAARLEELDRQATQLRNENDTLRVLAARVECPYGHRTATGSCRLGYPGCACMDDLMVAVERYPEDTEGAANERLKRRAEAVEAELKRVKGLLYPAKQ